MRQGAGDEKIWYRQQFLHLLIAPLISPIIAALGAMAVAAGMIGIHALITGIAIIDMPAHDLRSTEFDILHGLDVAL